MSMSKKACSANGCKRNLTRENKSGLCPDHKKAAFWATKPVRPCSQCREVLHYNVKGELCGKCISLNAQAKRKQCSVCGDDVWTRSTTGKCKAHSSPLPVPIPSREGPAPIARPFTIDGLIRAASRFTYTSIDELNGKSRLKWIVRIRFAIWHLAFPYYSFAHIGRVMGGKDHSTIVNGVSVAADLIAKDKFFAGLVQSIEREALAMVEIERKRMERIAA